MLLFYMNHGYSSSSCLLTCCQEKKPRDNILAYAYSKVKFTKAKEATQNTQGICKYIPSASNAVNISLWPGPFSVQGGQASSEDTESRYSMQYEERLDPFSTFNRKVPPSYKYTTVDNPITNFCRKTFNYKIFINMEYDSYDILCILRSWFYIISES